MKKALFIAIVIIFLLIINDSIHSIYDVWQKKDLVSKVEKELFFQKQQNNKLKSQLSYAQTPEFTEREARDKLFMTKEGEQRVLIPQDGDNIEESPPGEEKNLPNWKQWWNLFF